MTNTTTANLAVLIDADNAQWSLIAELFAEAATYGTLTVKRAYGDWTTPKLAGWKNVLNAHAIQPIQQFSYTSGKNATDSALIIDAMDLLHSGRLDGFCLVSSDSDFTRLATRLRESGVAVYGFGERKTPKPFVAACDRFVFTENLRDEPNGTKANNTADGKTLKSALLNAVSTAAQDDGWANLAGVGSLLVKNDPSFDPRTYSFKKLGALVRAQSYLEVKTVVVSEDSGHAHMYVRIKET